MLAIGFNALQSGNSAAAEQISRQLLARNPEDEGALVLLAMALDSAGRGGEALETFKRITKLFPARAEHWVNYGNSLRQLGDDAKAADAYRQSLQCDPGQSDALQNLGLIQYQRGLFLGARQYLRDALALRPDDGALRVQTAAACYEAGNNDEALDLLEGWAQWAATGELQVLVDLASLHNEMGDLAASEQALLLAERLQPGDIRVAIRRAAFLERSNRVNEANTIIAGIQRKDAQQAGLVEDFDLVKADIAARGDDTDEACRQHEYLLANPSIAQRRLTLYYALGRLNDKRGRPDEAMRWLQTGHDVQLSQLRQAAPELLSPESMNRLGQRRVSREEHDRWNLTGAPTAEESPIFVVGFPRSGTTLLETLLDAHEQLTCMDERTFINDLAKQIEADGIDYPFGLDRLDDAQCARLREKYWNLVHTRTSADATRRLIDKNPLNMMRLPVIARLFPHAKVILCVRDPRDVVLSNYMQIFRAPAYAMMCGTLETTAVGYAAAFDYWFAQTAALDLDILTLHHEDMIGDVEAHARRLCEFLDIAWSPGMVAFHEHALQRGFIRTPSYYQVVEPVNRKGVGRWQRYRQWMEPALPHLAPYVERFGYEPS